MLPKKTLIAQGGVFRCCTQSVGEQLYPEEGDILNVEIGHELTCTFCKREFKLTRVEEPDTVNYVWKPVME